MCGRFTLRASASAIAEQFSLFEVPELPPRYNIAPSQPVAVVRRRPQSGDDQRQLVLMRWGLIPSWATDPAIGNRLANARSESVLEKPAFRAAMRRRRCLIPADGFYEWKKNGRNKQPYLIGLRDGRLFAFAGLWEAWEGADHSYVESCTILTTTPNELMAPIHDRMPVILPAEAYGPWLDPAVPPAEVLAWLRPLPADQMTAYPVSTLVNNPRNDRPECVAPLVA
jgi:putative SOS response-associated peptidase YedK